MKTNLKLSSKMHIFIIVSCILIAAGLAVGTICHFIAGGFFNYGGDYESFKSVTVDYQSIDFSGGEKEPLELIEEICDKAFADAGVSSHVVTQGTISNGGKLVYKFVYSTDYNKLSEASEAINVAIKASVTGADGIRFSYASAHSAETLLGSGLALSRAAIVVACMVAVHFIYFAVRYKLTMAIGALLADIHNFALFIALAALCRIPVGSAIAVYAVIAVALSIIGTCFFFDRVRKNIKDEAGKKLTACELSDKSANESFTTNISMHICLAAVSVLLFVLLSISSLSPLAILSPVLCSLIAFVSCAYGTTMFTPSVYAGIKQLGDKVKPVSKTVKNTK
ncbi:MAG: hypothetical protein K2L42_01135 [Clostridia bacterium]|nr:hypothetical protein [Clostridia bacterium]